MIGGQVGIIGHLNIANNVKIAAQSGVGGSNKRSGSFQQGSPSIDAGKYQRSYVGFRRLPEFNEKTKRIGKGDQILKKSVEINGKTKNFTNSC